MKRIRTEQLFENVRRELAETYPDLRVTMENERITAMGSFPILYDGEILDRFLIELVVPENFPDSTPILRETGNRVPPISDRHINDLTGEACPLVPEEWLLLPLEQRTVSSFLEGPVRNFFIGQSLVERGEPWPWGERPHGRPGLMQAYGEMLGIDDENTILRYLEYLCHKEIKGHWQCPCGSSMRLRHCHIENIRELQRRIPCNVARSAFARLKSK
jgi:hypothetical protein